MCDEPATGGEHVPPLCIFPAARQHRVNLIVVPSCSAHNQKKTREDEIFRSVLVTSPGCNDLPLQVLDEGLLLSWDKQPKLLAECLPDLTELRVGNIETASYTLPSRRFEASIEAVVRGLWFHQRQEKLLAKLTVLWGAMLGADLSISPVYATIRRVEGNLPPMRRGSNPRVFMFDFHQPEDKQGWLCRLRFYEGHPIYVTWKVSLAPSG